MCLPKAINFGTVLFLFGIREFIHLRSFPGESEYLSIKNSCAKTQNADSKAATTILIRFKWFTEIITGINLQALYIQKYYGRRTGGPNAKCKFCRNWLHSSDVLHYCSALSSQQ